MKKSSRILFAVLLILALSPVLALAQSSHGKPSKVPHGKYATMRGTVQLFTQRALTIRDLKNPNLLRTFTYAPKLFRKMQKRRYAWGRRVKVKYYRGTDVAVSVK